MPGLMRLAARRFAPHTRIDINEMGYLTPAAISLRVVVRLDYFAASIKRSAGHNATANGKCQPTDWE